MDKNKRVEFIEWNLKGLREEKDAIEKAIKENEKELKEITEE